MAVLSTRALVFWAAGEAGAQQGRFDTDGDGLLDTVEMNTGTDPLRLDGDGDNSDDGTEVSFDTDPTDPASSLDANSRKLLAPDGSADDQFGFSVAFSSSGDTAMVRARFDDTAAGIIDVGSAERGMLARRGC